MFEKGHCQVSTHWPVTQFANTNTPWLQKDDCLLLSFGDQGTTGEIKSSVSVLEVRSSSLLPQTPRIGPSGSHDIYASIRLVTGSGCVLPHATLWGQQASLLLVMSPHDPGASHSKTWETQAEALPLSSDCRTEQYLEWRWGSLQGQRPPPQVLGLVLMVSQPPVFSSLLILSSSRSFDATVSFFQFLEVNTVWSVSFISYSKQWSWHTDFRYCFGCMHRFCMQDSYCHLSWKLLSLKYSEHWFSPF